MKALLMMLWGVFWIFSLRAQTLSPQVVASSGQSYSSPDALLDFTIGEAVTSYFSVGTNSLSQGFHQPEILIVSIENKGYDVDFSIYPNPTAQYVTVTTTEENELRVHILDAIGKTILVSNLFTKELTLDLQKLISGRYMMLITNASGKPLHSYSLIKTNL